MRKFKLGNLKSFAQGHTVSGGPQTQIQVLLALKPVFMISVLCKYLPESLLEPDKTDETWLKHIETLRSSIASKKGSSDSV